MAIHVKGRILQYLLGNEPLWDYQITEKILREYNLSGEYWKGTVRVSLADLFSCGLIESVAEEIDDGTHFGCDKVLFRYRLTDFGRSRMQDTGLVI